MHAIVLQLNFKIANIGGSVNTAADFLCGLDSKATEKTRLEIKKDVQTTPTEMTTTSSDVILLGNNSSSHKQTTKMKPRSRPLNEKEITEVEAVWVAKGGTVLNEAN